jgi:hypothetical protein
MERGISPGEPGWYFVPFVSALAAPLMLLVLVAALAYEIAIRLDPRRLHERYRASDRSDCSRT